MVIARVFLIVSPQVQIGSPQMQIFGGGLNEQ